MEPSLAAIRQNENFVISKGLQYDELCKKISIYVTEIASCCDSSVLRKKTEKLMLQK